MACRTRAATRPRRPAACRPTIPGKEALIEAFYGRFDEMLDHPFPQMADLVERLHGAGTPLYLLSNAPGFLDAWLRGPARRRHPFLGRFRDYVVSGHVGCCKPDAAIYDLVCRTGGFRPDEAVLIDDNLPNVDGRPRLRHEGRPSPLGRPDDPGPA